jgi:hypothetical protein
MNQLDRSNMETHVTLLGWLFIVSNAIFILLGLCGLFLFQGVGGIVDDRFVTDLFSIITTVAAVLLAILGFPGLIAGYGLLRRETWGRYLALIVAFLGMVNFPIGTFLGIYAFFFMLLQQEANTYFT